MTKRIEALDWLRGLSALWVFSYHANVVTTSSKYFDAPSLGNWAEAGHHGVELFFVISGFVMAVTVPTDAHNDWKGMRGYAVRRVFRVFPTYLVVFLPLAALALVTGLGAPVTGTVEGYLASNILLLPRDDATSYVPVVAWTLTHEAMFYGVFALAYLRRRVATGALLAWAAACVFFEMRGMPVGWKMQLSALNLYFLLGVALASLDRSAPLLSKIPSGLWTAPLSWLGERSYGLYLVHYPLLIATGMVLVRTGVDVWALAPVSLILSLVVADALHRFVERPGIAMGHSLTGRASLPRSGMV